MSEPGTQNDKKMELLENQVGMLMRHFDTVQVFATKKDDGAKVTAKFAWGEGDSLVRYAQVDQWLEALRVAAIREANQE